MPSPATSLSPQASDCLPPRERATAFTLIELLVVIAIIAILAGLGFGAVGGALKTAKKAEVRSMANQIKLGLTSYYSEYGTWPTVTTTDPAFLQAMTGSSAVPTIPNRRGIRFLEVPAKFTNSSGIVTPKGFDKSGGQLNFNVVVDSDYNGKITLPGGEASGSVAVYVADPDKPTNFIGTW